MRYLLFTLLVIGLFTTCLNPSQSSEDESEAAYGNPPAEGFNLEASDPEAIAWADSVMEALGGRKAWDGARYFRWNFFGNRLWYWDKYTGNVRVEIPESETIVLYNLKSEEGALSQKGVEQTNPDSLDVYLDKARRGWINDSYWLFMPFKLKDSGVTLSYLGQDTLPEGKPAELLRLRFDGVGVTPENGYHLWIDKTDNLIKQWAFYRNADNPEPGFITPWVDYKSYQGILLASSRGPNYEIGDIMVYDSLAAAVFEDLNWEE
ncbi:MAG: hypothetical protein GYB31_06970 [Bacteroidetes bacterium]|nr:hypothetical protein [Bacteroidota bacterium]